MGISIRYQQLSYAQQDWYLDLILRNRNMYNDFLAFAETKFQGDSVRFLRTMTEIPWNGNTPVSPDVQRGVYATYIREGSFFQINIDADKVRAIKTSVDHEAAPDCGPAVKEIRQLLKDNKLIVNFLADREARAQAAR